MSFVRFLARPMLASMFVVGGLDSLRHASAKVPKTTANTLYFIYVPPGVRVVMGGSSSCQAFCGYHNAIGSTVFYAWWKVEYVWLPFLLMATAYGGVVWMERGKRDDAKKLLEMALAAPGTFVHRKDCQDLLAKANEKKP